MKLLITGGCGFLGTNLAADALKRGHETIVFDHLGRQGATQNLEWLRSQGLKCFLHADVRNANDVTRAIEDERPDVIFHLAGQVAMTTSIENPRLDFETNVLGSHNVLEAVRNFSPETPVLYSSTNKVYGDLEQFTYKEGAKRYTAKEWPKGFDETVSLDFRSPYGCSKGAADQYMLDYARIYGMKTVVFRHSSIFGGRQFSTSDQGWIGWFVQQAVETKANPKRMPFTISGNGKQVRDVLFAHDLVNCYFQAVDKIEDCKGQAFNIGGGQENSLSLLELFDFLQEHVGIRMDWTKLPPRVSDQKVFVADTTKAEKIFGWKPQISKAEGLQKMIGWISGSDYA
jgi:CDP-paratose 2-epimerase